MRRARLYKRLYKYFKGEAAAASLAGEGDGGVPLKRKKLLQTGTTLESEDVGTDVSLIG